MKWPLALPASFMARIARSLARHVVVGLELAGFEDDLEVGLAAASLTSTISSKTVR